MENGDGRSHLGRPGAARRARDLRRHPGSREDRLPADEAPEVVTLPLDHIADLSATETAFLSTGEVRLDQPHQSSPTHHGACPGKELSLPFTSSAEP